jgi:DNA-binding NarL/FixJ family response regulator
VIVLTTFDLDEYVHAALRAGASGFLLKDAKPDDLLAAVYLVAQGLTNAEIGIALHMSAATAKTHVGRLLTKLSARDRTHLVIAAYEAGLVDR